MFDRITFNPGILAGGACTRGMRINVALLVNLVANGMTTEEILADYPDLEEKGHPSAPTVRGLSYTSLNL